MSGGKKKEITWLALLKEKLNLKKTEGKPVSIADVAGEAKKEWVQIKEGSHPKYIQGKATFNKKKSHQTKKHGHTATTAPCNDTKEEEIMKKLVAECPKCMKKYKKLMKTRKNKKRGGAAGEEEVEEENNNTDIVMGGGGDAVEDDLIKNTEENAITEGGSNHESAESAKEPSSPKTEPEPATEEVSPDSAPATASATDVEQKGGKKKSRKNKSKKRKSKKLNR